MGQRNKVLADDDEVAAQTGRTLGEWTQLIDDAGFTREQHDAIVRFLIDEHRLQLYWAHCIAHKHCDRK